MKEDLYIEASGRGKGTSALSAFLEEKMQELEKETMKVPEIVSITVTWEEDEEPKQRRVDIKYEKYPPDTEGPYIGVLTLTTSSGDVREREVHWSDRYVFVSIVVGMIATEMYRDKYWCMEFPISFKCVFRLLGIKFGKEEIAITEIPQDLYSLSVEWVKEFVRKYIASGECEVEKGRIKECENLSFNYNRVFLLVENGGALELWRPVEDGETVSKYLEEFKRQYPFNILYLILDSGDRYMIVPINQKVRLPELKKLEITIGHFELEDTEKYVQEKAEMYPEIGGEILSLAEKITFLTINKIDDKNLLYYKYESGSIDSIDNEVEDYTKQEIMTTYEKYIDIGKEPYGYDITIETREAIDNDSEVMDVILDYFTNSVDRSDGDGSVINEVCVSFFSKKKDDDNIIKDAMHWGCGTSLRELMKKYYSEETRQELEPCHVVISATYEYRDYDIVVVRERHIILPVNFTREEIFS